MTNKTHYAMFAIAALTIMGYGMTPAFADNVYLSEQRTMSSGNNIIVEEDAGCGSNDRCKIYAAAFAGVGENDWYVEFGPDGNTSCSTVVVSAVGGSSWNESKTFYNLSSEVSTVLSGPTNIAVNDSFTVSVSYTGCS